MLNKFISIIRRFIFSFYGDKVINIGNLKLVVDFADAGGRQYSSPSYPYKELNNPLNKEIARSFNPDLIIDIGANYGFTGIVFASHFIKSKIILVEPSKKLCAYIKRNFEINNIKNYVIINSICGSANAQTASISLNPENSLDNRVTEESGWKREAVSSITINQIIEDYHENGNVFIKIDVQGYEWNIFKGAEKYLDHNNNWIIKSEFAPSLLESQDVDPIGFIKYLCDKYDVVELPLQYTRYKVDTIDHLFSSTLTSQDAEQFVSHICSLSSSRAGWCDLLIRSKNKLL